MMLTRVATGKALPFDPLAPNAETIAAMRDARRGQGAVLRKCRCAYLEHRVPSCLALALQVRAIAQKAAEKPLVDWLEQTEIQALPDAPDPATIAGLRDRAMLHLCSAAGLRVSELTPLTLDSLSGCGSETDHYQ